MLRGKLLTAVFGEAEKVFAFSHSLSLYRTRQTSASQPRCNERRNIESSYPTATRFLNDDDDDIWIKLFWKRWKWSVIQTSSFHGFICKISADIMSAQLVSELEQRPRCIESSSSVSVLITLVYFTRWYLRHLSDFICCSSGFRLRVGRYQRRWREHVPPKRCYLLTSVHGVTTQENNIRCNISALIPGFLKYIYVAFLSLSTIIPGS